MATRRTEYGKMGKMDNRGTPRIPTEHPYGGIAPSNPTFCRRFPAFALLVPPSPNAWYWSEGGTRDRGERSMGRWAHRATAGPHGTPIGGGCALRPAFLSAFARLRSSRCPLASPIRTIPNVSEVSKRRVLVGRVAYGSVNNGEWADGRNGPPITCDKGNLLASKRSSFYRQ